MALEIVWTKQAEKGYAKIIQYLDSHFGDKEIRSFIRQTHDFFDLLTEYPEMLRLQKSTNICIVDRLIKIQYLPTE